jgi:quinol monooxygenase YgiN
MTNNLWWLLTVKRKVGAEPEGVSDALFESMAAAALGRPGVLAYRRYEVGEEIHFFESFADSAATAAHIEGFLSAHAANFLEAVEPTSLTVYGNPDARVRELLAGFDPVYFTEGGPAAGAAGR